MSDGDTITVLTSAKQSVKVRLYGIDAPESKQVFGKAVRVEVVDKDRYGRSVGRVFVAELDVNLEMVRRGFAWWYRSYAKKDMALAKAEVEAKNAGRGLWADRGENGWRRREQMKELPEESRQLLRDAR